MRRWLVGMAVVLVPVGLATKVYGGTGAAWVRDYAGGVAYVWFWCLLTRALITRFRTPVICAGVFAATCVVEVSQLWQPDILAAARGTAVGRVLLGTDFDWWDFPHYAAGAAIGLAAIRTVERMRTGGSGDGVS